MAKRKAGRRRRKSRGDGSLETTLLAQLQTKREEQDHRPKVPPSTDTSQRETHEYWEKDFPEPK